MQIVGYALLRSALGAALAAACAFLYRITGAAVDIPFCTGLGALVGVLTGLIRAAPRRQTPAPVGQAPINAQPRRRTSHRLRAWLSRDFRWQRCSPALCRLLQRKSRALRGERIFRALHPGDLHPLDQALQAVQRDGTVRQVRCRFLPVDFEQVSANEANGHTDTVLLPELDPSTFIYVRLQLRARLDEHGHVVGYRCRIGRDLPAWHRAEAELRADSAAERDTARRRLRRVRADLERLKQSYRDLYHYSPVMYFSLDTDARLVTFNDTLLRALGRTRAELTGQPYSNLLDPGVIGVAAGQIPAREGEFETSWRKSDGALLSVWIRTIAVLDDKGGPVRFRSAALDLTEKNRLAEELRARRDEFERANVRLRQINSELEDFTYVVSHDLKEPLRTLQAYSHILAEEYSGQLGPDGFQYINHMVRASRRLGQLIDELLKLSQAGACARPPQRFNLIEAVATARQDLVDLIQRKEAIVLTEGSLPDIVGDPHRIMQLMTNLIANGLKYNQSAAPKVVVSAAPGADARSVVVAVRDNGIGIDPAHHEQIFGIFRRLHPSDQYEGTGAGLAICKKIVEAHGGKIWVESQPGGGSTFFFTLPRPPATLQAARRTTTPARVNGTADRPSGVTETASQAELRVDRRRLLLVEDMVDVGTIIRKLGQKSGLEITWFTTAEEAWDYLQEHQPDFLLLDINLPGMNGVELCRRVRTLPALSETPVALFAQDHDPARQEELRAAGATYLLSKDLLCQPASWQDKLREMLQQGRTVAAQ
jgi:PAS domain S-box-containing protein